jgi:hypothetical protein
LHFKHSGDYLFRPSRGVADDNLSVGSFGCEPRVFLGSSFIFFFFKMVDLKVNKKLLPIKAHYFLFNAGKLDLILLCIVGIFHYDFNRLFYIGTAPLMPYIPTYARQLGVPSSGVGIMYTIFPFVGLIAKP